MKLMPRIFNACQRKHSSQPCHLHNETTSDPPCTTSPSPSKQTPHRSSFKTRLSFVVAKLYEAVSPRSKVPILDNNRGFWLPELPVLSFHQKKNRYKMEIKRPKNVATSSAYSHRFSASYTMDDGRQDGQRSEILSHPRRTFSDVGVRSRNHVDVCGQVSPEWGSPARLSVFKKLMPCKLEGKVKESFVVMKRSEMPYEDFKQSMMEMIVENQLYEETDLRQLLQCFLSLNSWHHHGVIMEAFSDNLNTMCLDH